MRNKAVSALIAGLSAPALLCSPALAQAPATGAAPGPRAAECVPAPVRAGAPPPAPLKPRVQPPLRDDPTTAIPGVVAAGLRWKQIWQGPGNNADGIVPDTDGAILVAQKDNDTVIKLRSDGTSSVAVAGAKGIGSVNMDRQGRLWGVHRAEVPGSSKPDAASVVSAITILRPTRSVVADKWTDGSALSIRPNDLAPDSKGGAFFTGGCLYYAGPKGASVVAENLRTNGIVLSPDDRTLYVTNGGTVVAFDVTGVGAVANRRDFAKLPAGTGDGMAFDAAGRLYVTSEAGVYVYEQPSKEGGGKFLGLIPTPRPAITVAFAGPQRRTLYIVGTGAEDPAGKPIYQGPQLTAATVYEMPALAQGMKDRAK